MLAQRPSVANVSFAGSETLRGGYLCEWMPLSTGVYAVSVLIRVTNHPSTPGTRTLAGFLVARPICFCVRFCIYYKNITLIQVKVHLMQCVNFTAGSMQHVAGSPFYPQCYTAPSYGRPLLHVLYFHFQTSHSCILCSFTLAFALQLHSEQSSKRRQVTLLAITVFQHNFTHSISGLGDSDVFGVRQFYVTDKVHLAFSCCLVCTRASFLATACADIVCQRTGSATSAWRVHR